jgi:Lipopolysaccharide-assembly, LptC-related
MQIIQKKMIQTAKIGTGTMLLSFCVACLLLMSCEVEKKKQPFVAYNGPVDEADSIQVLYSEGSVLKVRVNTPKQLRFANDNKVFPKRIFIDFFSPITKQVMTTLEADSGRFDRGKNIYVVKGHVVVLKKETQEKLATNELIWNPTSKKVYTEGFCVIDRMLSGTHIKGFGFSADQDFANMSIKKPSGFFNTPSGLQ